MSPSNIPPITYTHGLYQSRPFSKIPQISILALLLASGLILYVIWPVDTLADGMMVGSSLLPVVVMLYMQAAKRRQGYHRQDAVINTFSILLLALTTTYVMPGAGIPMLLVPVALSVSLMTIFSRKQLRWMIGCSAVTMLITTYLAVSGGYTLPADVPAHTTIIVGGVAIGTFAVLSMLASYQDYISKMLVHLQSRNDELEQAKDSLEIKIQEHTQDLSSALQDLERSHHEIRKLAMTDGLTGIFNRRHFMDLAEKVAEEAARSERSLSMIMFDVDDFKQINDNYGHQCGDLLLRNVCRSVETVLPHEAIFARYGGEEFVILLPNTTRNEASAIAETIRALIERTSVSYIAHKVSTTVSVGVALSPNGNCRLEQLLMLADQAQYRAKHNGKNCICLA